MISLTRISQILGVIAGLDPAIQGPGVRSELPWMPGSSPGMT
jgi:hypothetical protein